MLAVALPRLKTGFSDKTVVRVPRRTDKSSSRRLWFGFGLSLGGSRLALQAAFAEYLFLDTHSHARDICAAACCPAMRPNTTADKSPLPDK